ncbi:MAG TPA: SH3 domain-containing protein [Aggregatilineales bacterium]|nr:SH3 domain-containing protein [Anaerolineales bacterium]HRE49067.1 SH3 domain-containing protein [Aggregatilineales bacterium]
MVRKFTLFMLTVVLILTVLPAGIAAAQEPHAWTTVDTNVRVSPTTQGAVITTLKTETAVFIDGRNNNNGWILIHTADGVRGWAFARLFRYAAGVFVSNFPESSETFTPPAAADPVVEPSGPLPSGVGALNAPNVPKITPAIRTAMRAIMAKGKDLGNNFRVFSKVGDCQTDHHSFLKPIGWGQYNLGQYGYLQEVINYFMVQPRPDANNPFDLQSVASNNGFNSSAVMQPEFAAPYCNAGEQPLDCEYRLNKPGIAIIMFGTSDVLVMLPEQFDKFMRLVVKKTLDAGIIPILSTFPENPAVAEKSRQFNKIVLAIGKRYNVPVMNLADAVRGLPNNGLEPDGIHLTNPPSDNAGVIDEANLQYGFTVRNLLVLQTLDAVWRGILN